MQLITLAQGWGLHAVSAKLILQAYMRTRTLTLNQTSILSFCQEQNCRTPPSIRNFNYLSNLNVMSLRKLRKIEEVLWINLIKNLKTPASCGKVKAECIYISRQPKYMYVGNPSVSNKTNTYHRENRTEISSSL